MQSWLQYGGVNSHFRGLGEPSRYSSELRCFNPIRFLFLAFCRHFVRRVLVVLFAVSVRISFRQEFLKVHSSGCGKLQLQVLVSEDCSRSPPVPRSGWSPNLENKGVSPVDI
jgi:hypothetical protein